MRLRDRVQVQELGDLRRVDAVELLLALEDQAELGVLLLDAGDAARGGALRADAGANLQLREVSINLGLVAYRKGDKPRAIGYFEEALQIEPDDPAARRNLDLLHGR